MGLFCRAALAVAALLVLLGAGSPQDRPLEEKTVYIPYKDLERVFEREGRGVFLPYDQFLQLWERARAVGPGGTPPVEAVTAAGQYEGTVEGKVATFQSRLSFEVLQEGWSEIPLALGGLALSEARVEGEGAILRTAEDGYRFVVPDRGKYNLDLSFGVKVEERAGQQSIAFQTPRAAVSKMKVVLPGKDLEVTLEPQLAATIREQTEEEGGGTEVLAFLGASDRIQVTWRPRGRLTDPGEALISASAFERVTVDEGVVQARVAYTLSVLRARVPAFAVRFPGGYKLTALEGADIREWSVRDDGDGRVAEISLNRGVEGEYELSLTIERVDPAFPGGGATLELPRVSLQGARRERGVVALHFAPDLRAKIADRTGATQVDVADLGADAQGAAFAFRYPQHPYSIKAEVEKIEPRVRADALAMTTLSDERIDHRSHYTFVIQRGGLFRLRLRLPEGYELVDVTSQQGIRDHRVVDRILEVDLQGRTTGSADLGVVLERRRTEAEGPVALPFLEAMDVIQESGLAGVAILESLKAVTEKTEGLVPRDIRDVAQRGIGVPRDHILSLAFSYQKQPVSAALRISRRESQTNAVVQTILDAREDRIKVSSVIRYSVRYAGVDSFQFTIPRMVGEEEIGEKIHDRIGGADIKEKKPEVLEDGRVRWVVTLQRKVLGDYALTVEYDLKLAKVSVGEPVAVVIPELTAEGVFNAEGYVAARKVPDIILEPDRETTSERIIARDPRELPPEMGAADAILAYHYIQQADTPASLGLKLTRYDYKPPLPTFISQMHVEAVLTKEGAIRTTASLSLMNKQRQFLRVRLPEGANLFTVKVDDVEKDVGRDETKPDLIYIDLAETRKQGEEILVWMRYDQPPTAEGGLPAIARHVVRMPEILGEADEETRPPVGRMSLNLYVPEDRVYLALSTSMRRIDAPRSFWEGLKRSLFGDDRGWYGTGALQALTDGMELHRRAEGGQNTVAGPVSKSGRIFSFYKLEGGGRVAITHMARPLHVTLDIAVFVFLLGVGFVLPQRGIISKNLAVFGMAGAALVLLTFVPESLRPYLTTALLASFVVGLLWSGHFVVTELRRPPARGGEVDA